MNTSENLRLSTSGTSIWVPDIIISGAQTGADYGGLLAAKALGIATGGYAPLGYRTEAGDKSDLGSVFGLIELPTHNYTDRTRKNVAMANAIISIAKDFQSPGTAMTQRWAFGMQVPYFEVPYPALPALENDFLLEDIRNWLAEHQPSVLMIAGNRESKARGIQDWTYAFIRRVFS